MDEMIYKSVAYNLKLKRIIVYSLGVIVLLIAVLAILFSNDDLDIKLFFAGFIGIFLLILLGFLIYRIVKLKNFVKNARECEIEIGRIDNWKRSYFKGRASIVINKDNKSYCSDTDFNLFNARTYVGKTVKYFLIENKIYIVEEISQEF